MDATLDTNQGLLKVIESLQSHSMEPQDQEAIFSTLMGQYPLPAEEDVARVVVDPSNLTPEEEAIVTAFLVNNPDFEPFFKKMIALIWDEFRKQLVSTLVDKLEPSSN